MTEETWKLEAENRVRNLMWTVSGNYSLDTKLDMDSFERSKYISLYDAVKQGAFAKQKCPRPLCGKKTVPGSRGRAVNDSGTDGGGYGGS